MSSFTGSETNYCFNVFETDGMTTSRSKLRPRKLSFIKVTKMANYQPTYLGEIELSEETLAHYGVKGMRWGRRLRGAYSKAVGHIRRRQSADKRRERYVAEKMADELRTGQSHTYGRNFRLPESYAHVQRFINEHHGRAEQRRSMNGPWVKGSQYVYKTTSEQLNRAVDARKKRDGEPRRKRKYKPERT